MDTNLSKQIQHKLGQHGLEVSINSNDDGSLAVQVASSNLAVCKTNITQEDGVESTINGMIDEIVMQINNDQKNSLHLALNFSHKFRSHKGFIGLLIEEVAERFGFKLAVGSLQDKRFGHTLNVSLDSVPAFIRLARLHPIELPVEMMENIGECIENGYHQAPKSKEEVLDLLRTESTYDRWSPLLKESLFKTLLSNIDGVDLLYAVGVQKSTTHKK